MSVWLQAVQVVQALLVPVIAAIAAYVAWQQMENARAKLRHDLFDRRYAVFEAARVFLSGILIEGKLELNELYRYRSAIAAAPFLFDEAMCAYLNNLGKRALDMQSAFDQLGGEGGDTRKRLVEKAHQELTWLSEQLPVMTDRFKPFLGLHDRRW